MLSISGSSETPVSINLSGFSLTIYPNKNYITNRTEYALEVCPTGNFSADLIPDTPYHFVFDIDSSGSMGSRLPTVDYSTPAYSRMEIVQKALISIMEFLSSLAKEGKEIYVSFITFSTTSTIIVDHQKVMGNIELVSPIIDKIKGIVLGGATNMGCSIDNVQSLVNMYPEEQVYTMLISDGYINQGTPSHELKQIYSGYFNSSIGIGKESDYDKTLLQEITSEDTERSCNDVVEMKDQIIDSVFGNLNTILHELNLGNTSCITDSTSTTVDSSTGNVISKNMRITSKVFAILNSGDNTIQFNGIPESYLKDTVNSQIRTSCSSVSHYTIGDVNVTYNHTDNIIGDYDENEVNILLRLDLKPMTVNSSISRQFRIMQQFIRISNGIIALDTDNIVDNISKIKKLYDNIGSFTHLLSKMADTTTNQYMNTVVSKFKDSLEPYVASNSLYNGGQSFGFGQLAPPTLIRMCSSQASQGSWAFTGRQVSAGYSQSVSGFFQDDNQQNVNPAESAVAPVSVPNLGSVPNVAFMNAIPPPPNLGPVPSSNNHSGDILTMPSLVHSSSNAPIPPPTLAIPSNISVGSLASSTHSALSS